MPRVTDVEQVEQQRATSAFVRKGEQVVWGSEIMYYDKDTMEAMMPTEGGAWADGGCSPHQQRWCCSLA
jgi:hypothetical protein